MPNRGIRKKRKKLLAKSGLTKKETSHIREFGELHPAFESSSEDDSDESKAQNGKNRHFHETHFEKKPVLFEPKRKSNLEKIESILKADSEAVPKHSYEELLDCLSSVESDAESNDEANESENEDEQQSSEGDQNDVGHNSDHSENGADGEAVEDYETNLADVDLDSADEMDDSKQEPKPKQDTVDESGDLRSASESNCSASDSDGERTCSTGAKKRKLTKSGPKKKRKVVSAFKRHLETELSRNTLEALRSGTASLQSGNGEFETVKWTYAGLNDVGTFLSDANLRDPFSVIAYRDALRDAAFYWNAAHGSLRVSVSRDAPLSIAQRELAALAFNYFDVYYAPHRSAAPALIDHRLVYTLHALSHVMRARSVVMKHNLRLRSAAEVRARRTLTQLRKDKRARKARGEPAVAAREYRDQQFTRPKVLIVVPFRESAKRIVTLLCELLAGGGTSKTRKKSIDAEAEAKSDRTRLGKLQILNKRRFLAEFGDPDADGETETTQPTGGSKPPDFTETFAGNIDDHFRIGVAVKKRSVRLYSEFYSSDIIIASPLGLRTLICPADGEEDDEEDRDAKATKSSQNDADFLSSIELLVVDQADVIEMQNLEHLHYVLDHLNLMPRASHGADLSRVRMWALDGASRFYRQTLFFAAQPTLDTLGAFHQSSRNFEGRFVLLDQPRTASLAQVLVPHKHVFLRVPSASFANAPDARFDYFVNQLLPKWFDSSSGAFERRHVLIFVASYFDYVRLRNHFRRTDANVALLSEYADADAVMTARGLFYAGRVPLALYTERMHFYHRYRIRGVRHVIFYQLPRYAHFYAEVCNWLLDPATRRRNRRREAQNEPAQSSTASVADAPDDCSITVLFNRYDRYQLEGVLGHERTMRMIGSATSDTEHASSGNTFVYYAAK